MVSNPVKYYATSKNNEESLCLLVLNMSMIYCKLKKHFLNQKVEYDKKNASLSFSSLSMQRCLDKYRKKSEKEGPQLLLGGGVRELCFHVFLYIIFQGSE